MSFFELYGKQFNYVKVGISVTKNGSYFRKESRDHLDATRPYLLSIENPLHPEIDIGKNSFAIMRVRKAFEYAYNQLISPDPTDKYPTLLSRLVGIRDEKLRNRKMPPTYEELHPEFEPLFDEDESVKINQQIPIKNNEIAQNEEEISEADNYQEYAEEIEDFENELADKNVNNEDEILNDISNEDDFNSIAEENSEMELSDYEQGDPILDTDETPSVPFVVKLKKPEPKPKNIRKREGGHGYSLVALKPKKNKLKIF